MILLDTNVLSELMRPEPLPAVLTALRSHAAEEFCTAAICEAEIRYGLAAMPRGRKRDGSEDRFEALLSRGMKLLVLPFDSVCARHYGNLRARSRSAGRLIATLDHMIAATALAHGASLATRNVKDFEATGVKLIDPWQQP